VIISFFFNEIISIFPPQKDFKIWGLKYLFSKTTIVLDALAVLSFVIKIINHKCYFWLSVIVHPLNCKLLTAVGINFLSKPVLLILTQINDFFLLIKTIRAKDFQRVYPTRTSAETKTILCRNSITQYDTIMIVSNLEIKT